jgi:hypothetical protein
MIKTDISGVLQFLPGGRLESIWGDKLAAAHTRLESGEEFTGWLHLPSRITKRSLRSLMRQRRKSGATATCCW